MVYAKNRQNFTLNKIDKDVKELTKYFNFKDEKGSFHKRELKQSETQAGSREDRPFMFYPILVKKDKVKSITKDEFMGIYNKETKIFNDDFLNTLKQKYSDFDFILPIKNDKNFGRWTCGFDSFLMMLENNEIMTENSKIYKKEYLQNERNSKVVPFLFNETNLFNGIATQEIKALFTPSLRGEAEAIHKKADFNVDCHEFDKSNSRNDERGKVDYHDSANAESRNDKAETLFATPKPEALIKRIIEISTQENDLVMDFFAGSGTTLAVAHKMNRRWIGIEQMDYIESITKERLKKVVAGEQGGISKAVDWQGGGGFIYCELMPLNIVYKEKLLSLQGEAQAFHNQKVDSSVDCHDFANAKSRNDKEVEKELEKIYNDLESKAFVDYRVDIQAMLQDKEFHALSVDEKLKVLYAILDSNMDYVLYDDIDDSECGVSKELKELNRIFYGDSDE